MKIEINILDHGKMNYLCEHEPIFGMIEIHMYEIGKMIREIDNELIILRTETGLCDDLRMIIMNLENL
jgi:hypothetical protein